ncbi:hypothetical protein K2Z84_18595 [Candidatus Binatia bacterium]|jgi:hypothetical protein|nr:hypothetical protein [Candidatus Binatia bacterium]
MSTQRAFVIQFLPREGTADDFTGRVEHVGSGEVTHFTTSEELIRFLDRRNGRIPQAPERARVAGAAAGAAPPCRPQRERS